MFQKEGRILVPGYGDLTREVINELCSGRRYMQVQARRQQNAIAAEERALPGGQRKFLKFGRLRMRVSQEAFDYWGQRLGYECWDDPQFLREFERDNPEVRVKSRAYNTSVRMPRRIGRIGPMRPMPGKPAVVDQFGRTVA